MGVRAAVAALALALPLAAGAAEFADERLFTTAEQREQLDAARAAGGDDEGSDSEATSAAGVAEFDADTARRLAEEADEEPAAEIRLRGFISRSGGPPAVWLGDDRGEGPEQGRIVGDSVVIELPDGDTVRLEPGQVYDPATGEIRDVLGR